MRWLSSGAGLLGLVKPFITATILGNILLIFGLSIIAGGFGYKDRSFSRENISIQSSMLYVFLVWTPEASAEPLSEALAFMLLIVTSWNSIRVRYQQQAYVLGAPIY